mgnify:CR=1 FL=1
MLQLPAERRAQYDVSSLRVAVHAAAPCPIPLKRQMIEWWGDAIIEYYAGTERNGVAASFAELYQNRRVILTPLAENDPLDVQRVRTILEACGAEVTEMSVDHHDEVLAATSHLPHMLAFALVDMLSRVDYEEDIFKYAAGGFRDFTRIASSNPIMWRDICVANKDAVATLVESYADEMTQLAKAIRDDDIDTLTKMFTNAKKHRDAFIDGI